MVLGQSENLPNRLDCALFLFYFAMYFYFLLYFPVFKDNIQHMNIRQCIKCVKLVCISHLSSQVKKVAEDLGVFLEGLEYMHMLYCINGNRMHGTTLPPMQ